MCASADCISPEAKDEFYRDISRSPRSVRSTDVVIVGDFSAQPGYLAEAERHIGSPFSALANRTNKSDHFIHVCPDHRLFLEKANFHHKKQNRIIWRPHKPLRQRNQIDHIVIGHHWRESIEDCRLFWSIFVHLNHLIWARFQLLLVCSRTNTETTGPAYLIPDDNCWLQFQSELSARLQSKRNVQRPNEQWKISNGPCIPLSYYWQNTSGGFDKQLG